jgi:hypothetical protein
VAAQDDFTNGEFTAGRTGPLDTLLLIGDFTVNYWDLEVLYYDFTAMIYCDLQ